MSSHSSDAQTCLIGCMLLWPESVPKVMLGTQPMDFTGPAWTVYDAICRLKQQNQPVDLITVQHALGKTEMYRQYLVEAMDLVPSSAEIDRYITIVREQSRANTIRTLASNLLAADNLQEMGDLIRQLNGQMITSTRFRTMNNQQALEGFFADQTADPKYLEWPIKKLNGRLYARAGNFIIIGGSPSAGKSAFALQCAAHFARKHKVGFYSLETDNETLRDREFASFPGLSLDQIQQRRLTDRSWATVAQHSTGYLEWNMDRISAAGATVAEIQAHTAIMGFDVIFVDYLQLIEGSGSNRTEVVAGISRGLHTMAQSMGVTVIALSQLRRDHTGGSPSMSDLRESGQIEQDADIVMILQLEDANKQDGPRGLYVAKNKQGRRFKTLLAFDGNHQLFSEARVDGSPYKKQPADPLSGNRRPYDIPPPDPDNQMEIKDDEYLPPGW